MITQAKSKRNPRGGRYHASRKKKLYDRGSEPTLTKLGKTESRRLRVKAGHEKRRLLSGDIANLFDPKTKNYSKSKINTVVDNPANRHFIRRNIITKGAIIDTEKGKARVTSRPGQDGTINAVVISE